MTTISPRPEAQPRKHNDLSKTQQRAVSNILQFLDQFVPEPQRATVDKSPLVRLDLQRPSNVLLIDGERGSGKTETLLTLLGYWLSPFDPENKDLAEIRKSVDDAVRRGANAKRATGIPVPVLDMQPLPRGTSLLMQLATRLYKLVESHAASAPHGGDVPPLRAPADTGQTLRTAWQTLVRAAASAEPDGIRSRNLTPEDLADEMEAQERERASLNDGWSAFVSKLAEVDLRKLDYKGPDGGIPCLIVSIDDADMNPSRCVELLELVRSLWHPRVVFLLTGHIEMFHELLQRKFKKDGLSSVRAERLARLYFDKVVPSQQRFEVWADVDAALKLLSGSAGGWLNAMQSIPELSSAVPQRWRAVQDLEGSLNRSGAFGPTSARALLRSALDGADLAPSAVRHLERHVLPVLTEEDYEAKDLASFVLDDGDLVLQYELRKQAVGLRSALSLAVHKRGQWQVALKAGRVVAAGSANQAPIPLPREVEAALYLAAISADDIGEGGRLSRELTPASYPFADAHVKADKLDLSFAWPTPEWVKTIDFLLFRQRWEQILDEFRPRLAAAEEDRPDAAREEAVARLVYAFLSTLCALAKDGERSAFDAKDAATTVPDWDRLSERLFELAKDTSNPRQRAFADWAVTGATMFFWSEYGLPTPAGDAFARCWLRWLWRSTTDDHTYQALFGRVKDAQAHIVRRTAEQFRDMNVSDLKVLLDAVHLTRDPLLGTMFRDIDEKRVANWGNELSSRPETRIQIMHEIINDILTHIRLSEAQDLGNILNQSNFHYDEHLSFHLRDQLGQIWVVLPAGSPVALENRMSLEQYVRRHADMGDWPEQEMMWQIGSQTGPIRSLISSLRLYTPMDGAKVSSDALRETLQVFAGLMSWSLPDLGKDAMLAQTYNLPSVDVQDKSFAIQPGLSPDWTLQLTKIDRDAWWLEGSGKSGIQMVRMLTSLHDVVVDESDIELERTGTELNFEHHLCFTEQLAVKVKDSDQIFMVPEPNWLTVFELKMLVGNYGVIAEQMLRYLDTQKARTAINVYCLALIICANRALFRQPNWDFVSPIVKSPEWSQRKLGQERFAIRTARDYLSRIRSRHYRGRRWQAVEAWARYGVPLYAAPESGMTEEEAGEWLSLFADAIEQDRYQIRAVRRYRAKLALQKANKPCAVEDVEALLEQIDRSVPATHAWLRLIERRASPPTPPTGGAPSDASAENANEPPSTAEPAQA